MQNKVEQFHSSKSSQLNVLNVISYLVLLQDSVAAKSVKKEHNLCIHAHTPSMAVKLFVSHKTKRIHYTLLIFQQVPRSSCTQIDSDHGDNLCARHLTLN